ncbi:hypothetical protein [Paenibacillus sp. UMB4589-SE434]|uniref:hypothetical protein n=1 Tax=Paenibacillus sp. UMB4589-SE434 TaxID=3046314 RepID=UPI00254A8D04|nr:hypothetical protein [Paenibacillus sp. UMB4589-SE434]MDK8183739.1 hypothetical protein [Paenibacillus sp. UMB4589-SE434]
MKRFEIDCNYNYFGPSKLGLSHEEVIKLSLIPNERVLVFQDEDEWLGTVVFYKELPYVYQWYVKLD